MSKDEFKQYMYGKTMPSGMNASSCFGEIDSMRAEVSTIHEYIGASFGATQHTQLSMIDQFLDASFGATQHTQLSMIDQFLDASFGATQHTQLSMIDQFLDASFGATQHTQLSMIESVLAGMSNVNKYIGASFGTTQHTQLSMIDQFLDASFGATQHTQLSMIDQFLDASFGASQHTLIDMLGSSSYGLQVIKDEIRTRDFGGTFSASAGLSMVSAFNIFEITKASFPMYELGKQTINLSGFNGAATVGDTIEIWQEQKVDGSAYRQISESKTFTATSTLRDATVDEFESAEDYRIRATVSADRGAVSFPYNFLLRKTS